MQKLRTLDDIGAMLEATGRFKVLRRIPQTLDVPEENYDVASALIGAVLETDKMIREPGVRGPLEIAIIKFAYDSSTGRVLRVLGEFEGLQPLGPRDHVAAGQKAAGEAGTRRQAIESADLEAFLDDVNLIVAFAPSSVRPVVEAYWPKAFGSKPWACACDAVGLRTRAGRLRDLLGTIGFYQDEHRPLTDAQALLHIVARPLPTSARPTLAVILDNARKATDVIFAEHAPAEASGLLQERGYRWLRGGDGLPACWCREVEGLNDELSWLRTTVYAGLDKGPSRVRVTARNRYRPFHDLARGRVAAPSLSADGAA